MSSIQIRAISAIRETLARQKAKNDPKLIAAARELRDRWLEQVNSGQYLPAAAGKYEIGRSLPETRQMPLLVEGAAVAA